MTDNQNNFERHSVITLRLLKNVILSGNYETRSSILSLIDRLTNDQKLGSVIKR